MNNVSDGKQLSKQASLLDAREKFLDIAVS